MSEYNFHLKETFKKLKELSGGEMSREEMFQEAVRTWKEMSRETREELYGDLAMQDKERHDREMEVYHPELDAWRERRGIPIDERKPAAKPTPEELVTTAVTDHPQESSHPPPEEPDRHHAGVNSFAGETNSQEGAIHVPALPPVIALNGIEAPLNEVAAPPSQAGDHQEVHGTSVWDENTHNSVVSVVAYNPFQGSIESNSHPVSYEQCLLDSSVGDENVQGSTPSAVTNKKRKKRKNDSPYWYKDFQVYELEGYSDGTPLKAGHVWVEYDSGVAVQVKKSDMVENLPARNSRRKLSHNLLRL